ncbi:MAG: thiol-disulfide isomerase [Acidobacteria bacterium]|nr:thiol-disulfide isomerase [Acidobacteriota bacterium]
MNIRYPRLAVVVVGTPCLFFLGIAASTRTGQPTFSRDVAPIFYKACVDCHRPGEAAPMSLLTYKEARPWAKSVKEKVSDRAMPPWLADPRFGHFENDRRLSEKEIATIVSWVNAGAPKGNDKDLPAPPKFVEGWTLGQPDVVLSMREEFEVPADGVVPYKYFTIPTNITEDKWVNAVELRPGNRGVVHHIIAFLQEPGKPFRGEGSASNLLGGTAPGDPPNRYPEGTAKLVKTGTNIVLQMHYTPNGEPTKDRSSVGLFFAKVPPKKTAVTGAAMNVRFVIPPGDPNYEVKSSWTAKEDIHLVGLMPHMHVRGKDFTYTVTYPDGRSEIILSVPRYDFNWQLGYRFKQLIALPKDSRIDCVAHFDNSINNKFNPDPTKEVRWGDQTWEEMMIGWFTYTRDTEQLPNPVSTASVNK